VELAVEVHSFKRLGAQKEILGTNVKGIGIGMEV
jgi:hypothetical protein